MIAPITFETGGTAMSPFPFIDTSGLAPLELPRSLTDHSAGGMPSSSAPSPEAIARFQAAMGESPTRQATVVVPPAQAPVDPLAAAPSSSPAPVASAEPFRGSAVPVQTVVPFGGESAGQQSPVVPPAQAPVVPPAAAPSSSPAPVMPAVPPAQVSVPLGTELSASAAPVGLVEPDRRAAAVPSDIPLAGTGASAAREASTVQPPQVADANLSSQISVPASDAISVASSAAPASVVPDGSVRSPDASVLPVAPRPDALPSQLPSAVIAPQSVAPAAIEQSSVIPPAVPSSRASTEVPVAAANPDVGGRQPVADIQPKDAVAIEKTVLDDQSEESTFAVPQLHAAPIGMPFAPTDVAPMTTVAPVAIEIDPAAATARTHELVEAATQVADTILVTPSLVQGEGEITIQLKQAVLDGSEIRLEVRGESITVAITPATPSAAQVISQAKAQFEQTLAERIPSFQIAVSVESLKAARRKDTTV